jgi:hypothetical protein
VGHNRYCETDSIFGDPDWLDSEDEELTLLV